MPVWTSSSDTIPSSVRCDRRRPVSSPRRTKASRAPCQTTLNSEAAVATDSPRRTTPAQRPRTRLVAPHTAPSQQSPTAGPHPHQIPSGRFGGQSFVPNRRIETSHPSAGGGQPRGTRSPGDSARCRAGRPTPPTLGRRGWEAAPGVGRTALSPLAGDQAVAL